MQQFQEKNHAFTLKKDEPIKKRDRNQISAPFLIKAIL